MPAHAGDYTCMQYGRSIPPLHCFFSTLTHRCLLFQQVRHVGVSNETSYGVMRFIQAAEQSGLPRMASIQNVYSLLSRVQFDTNLAEVCAPRQCNVGLLAYSPLAGGALSGKYIKGGEDLPKARFNIFPGIKQALELFDAGH